MAPVGILVRTTEHGKAAGPDCAQKHCKLEYTVDDGFACHSKQAAGSLKQI